MIHFSVTPKQASGLLRVMINVYRGNKYNLTKYLSRDDCREIAEILEDAGVLAAPERRSTTSTKLEEIQTREGVELCPRVS